MACSEHPASSANADYTNTTDKNDRAITVRAFQNTSCDTQRWEDFISRPPDADADIFHSIRVRNIINATMPNCRCFYRMAFCGSPDNREQDLVGISPLVHVSHLLFSSRLVSPAFFVYGGLLSSSIVAQNKRLCDAENIAKALSVLYIENEGKGLPCGHWPVMPLTHVFFRKAIEEESQARFLNIPRKRPADVRKAIEGGLTFCVTENVQVFYDLYSKSMHKHGTPVHAKSWYERIMSGFGLDCRILVAQDRKNPIAALMAFFFRGIVYPYYMGSVVSAREMRGMDFLYWKLMEFSIECGGSGAYMYKKHWGFTPQPVYYQCFSEDAIHLASRHSFYQRWGSKLWKILPLAMTKRFGHLFARGIA
jgi:FemAB-related protein (PEP-CTERM system-associated)